MLIPIFEFSGALACFYMGYYERRVQPTARKWLRWIVAGSLLALLGAFDLMRRT
jgi:hypothetical protein